jgi:hypothetical protein
MHPPADAVTCFKHGDLPACAMQVKRSGKTSHARANDGYGFVCGCHDCSL